MDSLVGAVLIIAAVVGFAAAWQWLREETPDEPDPSDSAGA